MATGLTCALAVATGVLFLGGVAATAGFAEDRDSRSEIGFSIAEDQGIALDRDNPAQGLGSYLVNAAGCNDCHTWLNFADGGNPYIRQPKQTNIANFLAGGRLFALPTENVCSRNITPEPGTHKPAGLSRAEFQYVLKTGCDPQEANFHDPGSCGLLQVMPWSNYQDLKSQDINAIYAFLSVLPHTEPGPAAQCVPAPQGVAGK